MYKRTSIRLFVCMFIICFMIMGSMHILARPHEELTFEPITFNPPVPEKRTLSNGMKIFLLEDHELPVFDISGLVKTGNIYDPADKIGLSNIFASVMRTGGTVSREPDALNEELESMAASVELSMSAEYGSVSLSTMAEDIEKGLEIFADVLRNPAFREDKLELRKQQAIEAIRRRNDNPIQLAWRNFSAILYGKDHPFGWYAEIENVESISVDDLKSYHQKYYQPDNIMLSITGDFETDTLIQQLEKVFEGWENTKIEYPNIATVENNPTPSVNHIHKDLAQTTMLIGHFGIKRTPDFPDYFALRVMNDILGEGGFTSRLMKEVREKHGLAYMVGSLMQTSYYTNPGEWFAYSQTRTDKSAEAISLIINIIRDLRENPVSDEELQRTNDSLINSFVFGFESSSQIAFQQMMLDYRGFAPDFLETFTDNIAKVTAQDVQNVAQKYLHPDALTIVTVGNQENFDRPLSEFGEVTEIEVKQPTPEPVEPMPEASAEDTAKVKAIVAAAVEAHGGLEKLKSVKTVELESKAQLHSPMGAVDVSAKAYQVYPDKQRQEMDTPQGNMIIVYDGKSGFINSPMGVQPLSPEMATSFKNSIFRDTIPLLINLTENDVPVHYIGMEDVEGTQAAHLQITQPSGEIFGLFISGETSLVIKVEYSETQPSINIKLERDSIYSDYQEVEGIMVPYRIVQHVNGELYITNSVTSVKFNTEIDESLFKESE